MEIVVRRGKIEDAAQCTAIYYQAFKANAERHNFPNEIAPPDSGTVASWSRRFSHPGYYGVVAELDGRIVGSNFLDERDPIAAVGPLTVDPSLQDNRVGRLLMEAVLIGPLATARCAPGAGSHSRSSLELYRWALKFEIWFLCRARPCRSPGHTYDRQPVRPDFAITCASGCTMRAIGAARCNRQGTATR
jgi:hypothetical protein